MPLPSGLQSFCWKISWYPYGGSLVCYLLLLIFFSLYLIFVSLINMRLSVLLLGFILYGICASWTWVTLSFPILGKFLAITSSNIFSGPFPFSSSSRTPIMWMLIHLMLSQRFLRLSLFIFILFSLFCSVAVISTTVFQLTYSFFCLRYSAIDSF